MRHLPISRVVLFLLVFVSSLSVAAAQVNLFMDPVAPTTSTAIAFYDFSSCGEVKSVTRNGSEIRITISEPPCTPPHAGPLLIPLPEKTLPPGEYRAVIYATTGIAVEPPLTFVVRNDDPSEPFRVRPFAVSTRGDLPILLEESSEFSFIHCSPGNPCRVIIGGIDAGEPRGLNNHLSVTAPPHAPGLVDVVLQRSNGSTTLKGALYYFDPNAVPLQSVFERILFRLMFNTAGVGGSQWRTETTIANPNPWYVENGNAIAAGTCVIPQAGPCGERLVPFDAVKTLGGDYPHGVALLAPRPEASALSFHLNVRDVSHAADNFGSEVPVVREHEFARGGVATLLDVPRDPRYRVKVRVYAFDDRGLDAQTAFGSVRITRTGVAGVELVSVPLARSCSGASCYTTPLYGELDLPAGTADDRVNLSVHVGDARTWTTAFASVTNNATQQVSIVSANGATTCLLCR